MKHHRLLHLLAVLSVAFALRLPLSQHRFVREQSKTSLFSTKERKAKSSSSSKASPTLSPTVASTSGNASTSSPFHTSRHLTIRDYSLEESDVNKGAYTFSQWELTDTSENEFDLVAKAIDEEYSRNASLTSDLSM